MKDGVYWLQRRRSGKIILGVRDVKFGGHDWPWAFVGTLRVDNDRGISKSFKVIKKLNIPINERK